MLTNGVTPAKAGIHLYCCTFNGFPLPVFTGTSFAGMTGELPHRGGVQSLSNAHDRTHRKRRAVCATRRVSFPP